MGGRSISYDSVRLNKEEYDIFIKCYDLCIASLKEIARTSDQSAYTAQRTLEFIDDQRKQHSSKKT